MKVGIAIPTYNRKELLNGLLDSIPDGFHIYVSDNGNFVTDFLKNNHRVNNIVTHNVVIPMFSNWNASIEAAHGCDYIAITSDDDTYEKNAYAVVSKYVSEYDADVFIFGHKYINGDSAVLGSYCPKRLELHASPNGLAEHFLGVDARMPSIFLKKTFLDEIGYFDDQTFTITAADSELIQRALLLGKVLYVPEVIASYRVWEGSLTNSTQATTKWLTEVDLWTKKIASLAVSSFSESTKNIYDWRLYSDEIFARNLLAGLSILYKQKSYKEISIHLKNNRIPQYASIKTKIRISKYMILACIKRLYGA
ncbi:glycosyltransferase family 2 protein [Shewanella decolorationis]|uniref:Glycosyltransferase family 2 protein n=1 Tax=Shewanella decolorationis TaxID=256839 RepID=A0A5B8QWS9_9GAMM|nr:glycosyltransferase [Shewanella decolorationis]QDZ90396.1 glycosyltransferase family 2 protein [Shewanella decolorationis]